MRSDWNLCDGEESRLLEQLDKIRAVLISDGRTLAQGALGWLWTRSERTIPIPGFKTVEQVTENAGAIHFGPLTAGQMEQIDILLERTPATGADNA